MANISAVVFDMYETLVPNNQEDWLSLFDHICREQGLGVDSRLFYREWKNIEVNFRRVRLNLEEPDKSPAFKSYEEAWRDCFSDVFKAMNLHGDALKAAKLAIYSMSLKAPFEEVPSSLSAIQARWKTAVLSNADDDYLMPTIKRIGVEFQAVFSSEMIRAYKPHPAGFHRILKALGVRAEETVYVGDNQFDDVLGSQRVGMRAVWINRYNAKLDSRLPAPDAEVTDLTELVDILERWE